MLVRLLLLLLLLLLLPIVVVIIVVVHDRRTRYGGIVSRCILSAIGNIPGCIDNIIDDCGGICHRPCRCGFIQFPFVVVAKTASISNVVIVRSLNEHRFGADSGGVCAESNVQSLHHSVIGASRIMLSALFGA